MLGQPLWWGGVYWARASCVGWPCFKSNRASNCIINHLIGAFTVGKHLKRLEDGRIFAIEKDTNGTFMIEECCDNHFAEMFTPEELRELAQEIIELAGQ